MSAALVISGINAALSLLEQFTPELRAMVAAGQISKEQESVVQARIELIRSGKFFDQPHWQLSSPDPTPPSPVVPTSPTGIPVVAAPVTVIAPPAP